MPIPAALVLGIMDLTIAALKAYPDARRAYDDWRSELEKMRREGRDMTPDECMAAIERFDRRIRANRRVLHADDPFADDPGDPEPRGGA